jgi:hypothetical protein
MDREFRRPVGEILLRCSRAVMGFAGKKREGAQFTTSRTLSNVCQT